MVLMGVWLHLIMETSQTTQKPPYLRPKWSKVHTFVSSCGSRMRSTKASPGHMLATQVLALLQISSLNKLPRGF